MKQYLILLRIPKIWLESSKRKDLISNINLGCKDMVIRKLEFQAFLRVSYWNNIIFAKHNAKNVKIKYNR